MIRRRLFFLVALIPCFYIVYGLWIKQTRWLSSELKEALIDLPAEITKISLPHPFETATNPGVVKEGDGYLMVYRIEHRSFWDFLWKNLTFSRNKVLGFCQLDSNLQVISHEILLKESAPGVKKSKQSPNDPRLISFQGKHYLFYNDRAYLPEKNSYVRQMYLCTVSKEGFGGAKKLEFSERSQFTEKGRKLAEVEKNWTPFVFQDRLYLVYLIEPFVITELNPETGKCTLIQENEAVNVWKYGLARGGTPCIQEGDYYLSFFHSACKGTSLGTAHPYIYVMGAYWFTATPPFELVKVTKRPLQGKGFYDGLRKLIFPTALIDEGEFYRLFYGKDDKEIWSMKIKKSDLQALAEKP